MLEHLNSSWRSAKGIPGQTKEEELEWLAALAAKVTSWTELGVFCGRSMLAVGLSLPKNAKLHLVDLHFGYHIRRGITALTTYSELIQQRPDLQILIAKCRSVDAARRLPNTDVVFVDAAHDEASVADDIRLWRPKCSILCGHDYHDNYPGLKKVVDRLEGSKLIVGSIWSTPLVGV